MLGLVDFNGDHSTKENQVLKDSDTAFLGLMSVMDADVGIGLDNPGSVGAAPLDKGFVDLDQLLLNDDTKPTVQSVVKIDNTTTDYTFSNFFGANISIGVLSVALRNFLEAGNDDKILDDELGLNSTLCLLHHSSLKQSMMVSARDEFQINFSFPSLINAACKIREHLCTGPCTLDGYELYWTLSEILSKLLIQNREKFAIIKNGRNFIFLNKSYEIYSVYKSIYTVLGQESCQINSSEM